MPSRVWLKSPFGFSMIIPLIMINPITKSGRFFNQPEGYVTQSLYLSLILTNGRINKQVLTKKDLTNNSVIPSCC